MCKINYNKTNNIIPTSTFRKIEESIVDEKSNDNRIKQNKESIDEMRKKMLAHAEDLNFEKAADLRDKIEILEKKILGINEKL